MINLVLEVTDLEQEDTNAPTSVASLAKLDAKESQHFVTRLMEAFWNLHTTKPANPMLAPVCLPGLFTTKHLQIFLTCFVPLVLGEI